MEEEVQRDMTRTRDYPLNIFRRNKRLRIAEPSWKDNQKPQLQSEREKHLGSDGMKMVRTMTDLDKLGKEEHTSVEENLTYRVNSYAAPNFLRSPNNLTS